MNYFDSLKAMFQGNYDPNAINEMYGVPQGVVDQARSGQLMQMGLGMIAAGQQLTPAQRAQVMQQIGSGAGDFQSSIYNAAQSRLMSDRIKMERQQREQQQAGMAQLTDMINQMPDTREKAMALRAMQIGEIDAAKKIVLGQGGGADDYDIRGDSKTGLFYVHKTDPTRPPIPIQGTQAAGGDDVKFSDRRGLINDFEKSPAVQAYDVLQPTMQSLASAVYDNSKISDLDFVYGVAKALDPTSVVRESEGQMVIDAQGLDGQLLARLNSLVGAGTLTPQTREQLFELVKRRAMAFRELALQQRNQILSVGQRYNILDQQDLRTLAPIPEIVRPQQTPNSDARQDRLPVQPPVVLPLITVQ